MMLISSVWVWFPGVDQLDALAAQGNRQPVLVDQVRRPHLFQCAAGGFGPADRVIAILVIEVECVLEVAARLPTLEPAVAVCIQTRGIRRERRIRGRHGEVGQHVLVTHKTGPCPRKRRRR